jgi:hypothetical protein
MDVIINILKNDPYLFNLFFNNNDKTKIKIIKCLNNFPSYLDTFGYCYGFTRLTDDNTKNNFYVKLGRTARSDLLIRLRVKLHIH